MDQVSFVLLATGEVSQVVSTIHSMLNQTYESLELIVVHESWATSEFVEALSKIPDERVLFLQSPSEPRNESVSTTEFGARFASGSFIGLCRGGSYYVPSYVKSLVRAMQEADADLAYADCVDGNPGYETFILDASVGGLSDDGWICRASLLHLGLESQETLARVVQNRASKVVKAPGILYVRNPITKSGQIVYSVNM